MATRKFTSKLFLVITLIVILVSCRAKNVSVDPPVNVASKLGAVMHFPDGYELVTAFYDYGYGDTFYICRNVETGEYRGCAPIS